MQTFHLSEELLTELQELREWYVQNQHTAPSFVTRVVLSKIKGIENTISHIESHYFIVNKPEDLN